MKKILIMLALTFVSAQAFAVTSQPEPLQAAPESPILVRGENMGDFSARIRSELTCENISQKLQNYETTLSDLNSSVKSNFRAVSRSLDRWDAELYQIVGRQGYRYTGALGSYARQIDQYVYNEYDHDQMKMVLFIRYLNERLTECASRPRQ